MTSWQERQEELMEGSRRELQEGYRQEMARFVAGLAEWTLFANPLTFDPLVMAGRDPEELAKKCRRDLAVPAVSRWTAMRRFRYFLERSSRVLERPTVGVIALEPHESGQPHGHGLMGIEGGLVGQEVATLGRFWREYPGNGWIRLEPPRSIEDVTSYSAKYMAKDASELVFSSSLGGVRRSGPQAAARPTRNQSRSEPGAGCDQPFRVGLTVGAGRLKWASWRSFGECSPVAVAVASPESERADRRAPRSSPGHEGNCLCV